MQRYYIELIEPKGDDYSPEWPIMETQDDLFECLDDVQVFVRRIELLDFEDRTFRDVTDDMLVAWTNQYLRDQGMNAERLPIIIGNDAADKVFCDAMRDMGHFDYVDGPVHHYA